MSLSLWQWVGAGLVLWVIYDLFAGYTYLHRKITRENETMLYWLVLLIWFVIALYTMGFM